MVFLKTDRNRFEFLSKDFQKIDYKAPTHTKCWAPPASQSQPLGCLPAGTPSISAPQATSLLAQRSARSPSRRVTFREKSSLSTSHMIQTLRGSAGPVALERPFCGQNGEKSTKIAKSEISEISASLGLTLTLPKPFTMNFSGTLPFRI